MLTGSIGGGCHGFFERGSRLGAALPHRAALLVFSRCRCGGPGYPGRRAMPQVRGPSSRVAVVEEGADARGAGAEARPRVDSLRRKFRQ